MRTSKLNTRTTNDIKQGTLLCATPINPNTDNFKTLVLITRHSDLGTTGVILNNPLGIKIHVNNLTHDPKVMELHYGGHIDEGLSFLLCMPSFRNGWKDSIYWSTNYTYLNILLKNIQTENICMSAYNGCMRWKPNELCAQVANKHWWATDDYVVNEITDSTVDTWSVIAGKTGGHFAPLVNVDAPIIFN